jgi:hypothetical protein
MTGLQRLTGIQRFAAGSATADPCQSVSYTYDDRTIWDATFGNDFYWGRLTEVSWVMQQRARRVG